MIPKFKNIPKLNLSLKAKKILAGTALFIVAAYGYNKYQKDKRKREAEALMATDKSAGQAEAIRSAMSTFGQDWWKWLTDNEKEEVFKIASEIEDLNAVHEKYKALTGRSLYDDLSKVFEPEDYQKFLSLASKGKVGSWYYAPKSEKVPVNNWVITKLSANVRTSASNVHWMYLNNNIVKKAVPAGRVLGITTGQFKYDEGNKTLFIEFYTFTSKNERKTYWVAKSQIETITNEEYKKRKANKSITQEVIEGIGKLETELENTKWVISRANCPIYNEQFEQTGIASKNSVLGHPLMILNTKKGKYIKFETIQGMLRWVNAELAVINE